MRERRRVGGAGEISDKRAYVRENRETVYSSHLSKDARENMGSDVLLNETRQV